MIHIAIIGLGNIAHKHAEVINALPDVELVAGVKRDLETGRAFCSQYGIPQYFQSTADLLAWGKFDAAVISCGHHFTVEIARSVLSTGRPCLIEKPVGFSPSETQSVLDAATCARTWGMVAVNRRFYSIIQKARELICDAGGLRAIRVEHTEWMHQASEWGLPDDLLDQYFFINGIHLLDTMCHLAGPPESTDAVARMFPGRRNAYDAMFRFRSGAIGHYSGQWYAPGRWALDLFAEDLRITFPRMEEAVVQRTGKGPEPLLLDEIDQKYKPGFYRQMQAFVQKAETLKTENLKGRIENPKSKILNPGSSLLPPSCFLPEAVEIMRVVEEVGGRASGKLAS
jgi:predicted dehydrogenase